MKCTVLIAFCMVSTILTAQEQAPAYLTVFLNAPDVRVYIDGQAEEMEPGSPKFEKELPPGRHVLRFERPGYVSSKWDRVFNEDSLYVIRLDWIEPEWEARRLVTSVDVMLRRQTTTFVVVSFPPGLFVSVNGISIGRTPVRVRHFPAGRTHFVVDSVGGYFELVHREFKRIKYVKSTRRLYDATVEIPNKTALRLEVTDAKLLASTEPELNLDWQKLATARPMNFFTDTASPMYLLDVLFFRNLSSEPLTFKRIVRVFRNGVQVEEKVYATRLEATSEPQAWYSYARRLWPEGFYRVEILDEDGAVLADIAFYIEKDR